MNTIPPSNDLYGTRFAAREAGGTDEHWAFRTITARIQVPQCQPQNYIQTEAGIRLIGYTDNPYAAWIVMSGFRDADHPATIAYGDHFAAAGRSIPVPGIPLAVGDWVRMEIHHTVYRDRFTVANITQNVTAPPNYVDIDPNFHVWYPHATWDATITSDNDLRTTPLPSANTLLWSFRDCRVTSVDPVRKNLFGPWNNAVCFITRDGTPTGQLVAAPGPPTDNLTGFDVYLWHA